MWGVACGRGPTLQALIPAFRMRTLWKAGPHLHGRPGRGEGDAPASPDSLHCGCSAVRAIVLVTSGFISLQTEGDCAPGVLGRELGCWGSRRAGQLSWALPLTGADTCDADRKYC